MKIIDDRDNLKVVVTYEADGVEQTISLPYKISPSDYSRNLRISEEMFKDLISLINTGKIQ